MRKNKPKSNSKPGVERVERQLCVPLPPALYLVEPFLRPDLEKVRRDQDHVALLRVFVNAMDMGLYPPVSILHRIKTAFQAVLGGKGKTTLDVALGLKGTEGSKWHAVTKQSREREAYWVASTMFMLITHYKLKQADAAERVSFYLESRPDLKFYKADGLMQQYSTWKAKFRLDTVPPTYPLHPPSWPPFMRAAFIKQFPRPDQSY